MPWGIRVAQVSDYTALLSTYSVHGTANRAAFYTYSFPIAPPDYLQARYAPSGLATFEAFSEAYKVLARRAIEAFASVSGLSLFEVPPGQGDIQFMIFDTAALGTPSGGFAFYPANGRNDSLASDLFINKATTQNDTNAYILLHELAHALGLKHGYEGATTFAPEVDNATYSVLSSQLARGFTGNLGTFDVQAIQYLYGTADRDGTQVVSWNWNPETYVLTQVGSDADDQISGLATGDVIRGAGGNDVLAGRDGSNFLYGDAGDDQIDGGSGDDRLDGGDGNDRLQGGNGANSLIGGAGDDTLFAGGGNDIFRGEGGNDLILAEEGDRVYGGDGDDTLGLIISGDLTSDVIDGGGGTDSANVFFSDSGPRMLTTSQFAGLGIERLTSLTLGNGADQIVVDGGAQIVAIDGRAGNDVIFAGNASGSINGGIGDDVIRVEGASGRIDGGAGADLIYAGSAFNFLYGGADADRFIFESAGTSTAGAQDQIEDFQTGIDRIDLTAFSPTDVRIQPSGSGSFVYATAGAGRFQLFVRNAISLSDIAYSVIEGGADADILDGTIGNDVIRGGGGNDTIRGGAGADTLTGGAGVDTFAGTLADVAGDTLVDFALGERILLTDAVIDGFRFQRAGNTLTLPGGATGVSVFIPAGANPMLVTRAASEGGVELIATGHEAHANDFNADGHGDLLWRHAPSGAFSTWDGQGNVLANSFVENSYFSAAQPVTTQGVASLDWNGDGRSDMLWRDAAGTFGVWAGGPDGFVRDATTIAGISRDWSVTAVGDFNGDGRDDLMFRNVNGALTVWQSAGAGFTPNVYVNFADPSWVVAGVMDFDGDGRDDIVWRNQGAGLFSIWTANGEGGATSFAPNTYVDASVDGSWSIAALADFNGDGKDDLLWRNAGGIFTEWQSTGSGFRTNVYANGTVAPDWAIAQAADMNGDGMADLLFRNLGDGRLTVWQSDGDGFIPNTALVASVSTDWALIGATGMVPLV